MLSRLSIRDIVLIDRLELSFERALCVLTGETGAGKSILLDALGLALGARGTGSLVRPGAERAQVTAEFEIADEHPVWTALAERELEAEAPLVLRRVLGRDGRSRAFVNDQPVSIGLLAELGAMLVEIHGQHQTRGLLNPATHRDLLDSFGGHHGLKAQVATAWEALSAARRREAESRAAAENALRDEAFLRHALEEIETLAPEPGEERQLDSERRFLAAGAGLATALESARNALAGEIEVESILSGALKVLERQRDAAGGRFDGAIGALERAALECGEALEQINAAAAALDADPDRQAQVEDRLFALRALARKHDIQADDLPEFGESLRRKLAAIDDSGENLSRLARATRAAEAEYAKAAARLRTARQTAIESLDPLIARELAPLKLDKARFQTAMVALEEDDWGRSGTERIAFQIATNPGTEPGPLNRIASGGELARIMLALKVVLASGGSLPTLIFDEVDSGISGATAAAVGERLARLGSDLQVLVVTHSPQVAARGACHWRVSKDGDREQASTQVVQLATEARREEIARMLAGAEITAEARAAAERLLSGGN